MGIACTELVEIFRMRRICHWNVYFVRPPLNTMAFESFKLCSHWESDLDINPWHIFVIILQCSRLQLSQHNDIFCFLVFNTSFMLRWSQFSPGTQYSMLKSPSCCRSMQWSSMRGFCGFEITKGKKKRFFLSPCVPEQYGGSFISWATALHHHIRIACGYIGLTQGDSHGMHTLQGGCRVKPKGAAMVVISVSCSKS